MDNDGDKDLGAAPLQNSVLAEETFDAVINLNEKSTSSMVAVTQLLRKRKLLKQSRTSATIVIHV